jgi:hypothetical protein
LRRAAKRDAIEPDVIATLEAFGCYVWRLDQPVDLLCGYRGRTYLVEVKSGKRGRLTGGQVDFIAAWRGGPVEIVRSADEALAMVKRWAGEAGGGA